MYYVYGTSKNKKGYADCRWKFRKIAILYFFFTMLRKNKKTRQQEEKKRKEIISKKKFQAAPLRNKKEKICWRGVLTKKLKIRGNTKFSHEIRTLIPFMKSMDNQDISLLN